MLRLSTAVPSPANQYLFTYGMYVVQATGCNKQNYAAGFMHDV